MSDNKDMLSRFVEATGPTAFKSADECIQDAQHAQRKARQFDIYITTPRWWAEKLWARCHSRSWRGHARRRFLRQFKKTCVSRERIVLLRSSEAHSEKEPEVIPKETNDNG